MKRLTWLVGPPGSGKSTYAAGQREYPRTVELDTMLGPLVDPLRIRKGVLAAHGCLVDAIRRIELLPANAALPPLLVVAGLVPEESLFPLSTEEEVLLLLPHRDRWQRQLRQRPVDGSSPNQYDDYEYSEVWYTRFADWRARALPMRQIEVPFERHLVGRAPIR